MAAPLPHWKRKTRPCPFYSQGRCLFADSCNFIHSARANIPSPNQHHSDELGAPSSVPQPHSSVQDARCFLKEQASEQAKDFDARSITSTIASSTPEGVERRKSYRVSLRSPPRSPRLSGLLFALQSVIGPDVEEVVEEVYDDEEPDGNGEGSTASNVVGEGGASSLDNAVQLVLERSPSLLDAPSVKQIDPSPSIASFDEPPFIVDTARISTASLSSSLSHEHSPTPAPSLSSPRPPSSTSRRPPAINTSLNFPIIAHAVNSDGSSPANDDNALPTIDNTSLSPLPSPGPKSPFELLSSPFASPARRMLASLPFPSAGSRDQASPGFHNFSHAMAMSSNMGFATSTTPPRQRVSSLDSDLDSPATTEKHGTPTFETREKRRSGTPASASDTTRTPKPGPQDSKSAAREGLPSPPALVLPAQLDAAAFLARGETDESTDSEEEERQSSVAYFEGVLDNYASPTGPVAHHSPPAFVLSAKKHSYDSLDADDELAYAEADEVDNEDEDEDDEQSSQAHSISRSSTSTSLSIIEPESDAVASVMDFYSSDDPSPFSTNINSASQSSDVFDSDASGLTSASVSRPPSVSQLKPPPTTYRSPVITHQSSTESFTRSMTNAPIVQRPPSTNNINANSPALSSQAKPSSRRTSAIVTSHSPSPSFSQSEEPQSSSSSNLSWEEVSKGAGGSMKISFGFRHQSLLLDTSVTALTPSQSRLSREGSAPAPRPNSYTPGTKSTPPSALEQSPSPTNLLSPQSASSAPGPSRTIRPSSWMKPLRLSQILDSPFGSESSSSRSRFKRFSRLSRNSRSSVTMSQQVHNVTTLGSPIDIHTHSSHPSTSSEPPPAPAHDISPLVLSSSGLHMTSVDAVLHSALNLDDTKTSIHASFNDTNNAEVKSGDDNPALDLLSPLSGSMAGFGYDDVVEGRSVRRSVVLERVEENEVSGETISEDIHSFSGVVGSPSAQTQEATFIQPAIQRDLSSSPEPSIYAEKTPTAFSTNASTITPSSDPPSHLPQITTPLPSRSPPLPPSAQPSLPPPRARSPGHAIATPRATLLFAIASDDPAAVERVLASGEAAPNDDVGPQSALEFALKNESLTRKTEIVKVLLAYGADPTGMKGAESVESGGGDAKGKGKETQVEDGSEGAVGEDADTHGKDSSDHMNPAMKYYLSRAAASQSAQSMAIRRSIYGPLTRIRFDFVGQDRALEQLYTVLSMHSQQHMVNPLVVMCCGPSGHGKSLLARKFGSLLDVPTHTVNMTILQSSHDLWQCPSMSPYETPSDQTLAEFLTENEGKRCVVVLDEIDKNEDEKNLWSLLAPWELGRCSIDAGRRHIDVRNVIWLGTSNIGQDLVFEYDSSRKDAEAPLTRTEFRELMALLRPKVTEKMGTALMSRVTTVLPFVPFTHNERLAIAAEALLALGGDAANGLPPETFNHVVDAAVAEYVPLEGARSLYRSVSTHLMDAI